MAQGIPHGAAPTRLEHDSMGWIEVPVKAMWGAQTQRSLVYFQISTERMPHALLMAVVRIKKAAALVNEQLGLLDQGKAQAIAQAAQEVLQGEHGDAFPLSLWQTGSGTQSHMNVNEVLANRASELMGGGRGADRCVDPHDDVNMGQSSNDVFPSAMHMACVGSLIQSLLPALQGLRATLASQSAACADITKVGRTHLQDATPLTLGQEMSGWVAQLAHAEQAISATLLPLYELAIGGTAVGNCINTHPQFGERVAAHLADELGWPLRCASNRYAAMAAHDALVNAHGALKTLAVALMKVANDVRWLASGPRCGLGELHLPENEPGSSIMPGKVNPTQCEALTMVCCQVMGNDVALTVGGASGNFELNVFKPLILQNFLQSSRLLADAMLSFDMHCARGIAPDLARIDQLLHRSLMNVTALVPHIGHDLTAQVAQYALKHDTALGDAATVVAGIAPAQFNEWLQAKKGVP